MKKLILAIAVVALFTACHSTTETDLQNSDSTSLFEKLDSITPLKDSVKVIDTTTIIDTIKK
jgi:hypothetical protein